MHDLIKVGVSRERERERERDGLDWLTQKFARNVIFR